MLEMPNIHERELTVKQRIIDQLLGNVEAFRVAAAAANRTFTQRERRALRKLEKSHISAFDFFIIWEDDFKEARDTLLRKRSDKQFRTSLTKHLALTIGEVDDTVETIVRTRDAQYIKKFVKRLYPSAPQRRDRFKKQRAQARKLITESPEQIQQRKDHYVSALLYRDIAAQYDISIVDPHTSSFTQLRALLAVRAERQNKERNETSRLHSIQQQLQDIDTRDGGILKGIIAYDLDFVQLLSLHTDYQKRVRKLSKIVSKQAAERRHAFEASTQTFRADYQQKLAMNLVHENLASVHEKTKEIDTLLFQVVNYTNLQKNQLVLSMKKYRELLSERDDILRSRAERHAHIA